MGGVLGSLVALLVGLAIVRWHGAVARFGFIATPWRPPRRAREVAGRECLVLGLVVAAGAAVSLLYCTMVALSAK